MAMRDRRRDEGLGRSVRLFRGFLVEQSDPDRFYRMLAVDSVEQVARFHDLADQLVLDVGGGPGYFADAFRSGGARYVSVDADAGEMSAAGLATGGSVLGSALALPFSDSSVDLCYSSNVLEHVPDPWAMGREMLRVTRSGGRVFLSFTNWLGPWGGHETAPWHYLGGRRAADRYSRRMGHPPKNDFGRSLFAVSVGDALRWARGSGAELEAQFPRYHPWWARGVVRVPGVREFGTWNLVLVLRKR